MDYYNNDIMRIISAADLVWIASASLERENPERKGFSHDEIRQRLYSLEPEHGFPGRNNSNAHHDSLRCEQKAGSQ